MKANVATAIDSVKTVLEGNTLKVYPKRKDGVIVDLINSMLT